MVYAVILENGVHGVLKISLFLTVCFSVLKCAVKGMGLHYEFNPCTGETKNFQDYS